MILIYKISIVLVILILPLSASSQMQISGLSDILFKNSEENDLTNLTFR